MGYVSRRRISSIEFHNFLVFHCTRAKFVQNERIFERILTCQNCLLYLIYFSLCLEKESLLLFCKRRNNFAVYSRQCYWCKICLVKLSFANNFFPYGLFVGFLFMTAMLFSRTSFFLFGKNISRVLAHIPRNVSRPHLEGLI